MEKLLFFYLKTGGGHLAPAKAVAEMMMTKHKDQISIHLTDGLAGSGILLKKIIEDGYTNAVNYAVWSFELLYAIHKIPVISKFTASLVSYLIKPNIEKKILLIKPSKIVVYHFFLIKPVFDIIRKYNLEIPVITIVTDPFTAHPIWFLHKGQNYIVFSESLRNKCIDMGIDKKCLQVFPFILDPKFTGKFSDHDKLIIRKNLGFEKESRIILIMGGGGGMPRGLKILKNIVARNMEAEIAIVCGKDKRLFEKALKLKKKYSINNLKVYPFIDFVHSLIDISDIVITKCGASTFMEILLMGKVPVINNYIWEQEKGNMEFICHKKMGILEKKIRILPDILHKLLTDNEYYNSFSDNIKDASITNGVAPVSDYILNFQH